MFSIITPCQKVFLSIYLVPKNFYVVELMNVLYIYIYMCLCGIVDWLLDSGDGEQGSIPR